MANKIVHWELMGADGDAQKAFYSTIFDWEFAATEGIENYHMTTAEATGVGGAVGQGNEHMPNYAAMYVEVGDINETLGVIEASGGSTVVPRTEIPGNCLLRIVQRPCRQLGRHCRIRYTRG